MQTQQKRLEYVERSVLVKTIRISARNEAIDTKSHREIHRKKKKSKEVIFDGEK